MHPRSPLSGIGGSILLISYQRLSLPIRLGRGLAYLATAGSGTSRTEVRRYGCMAVG
jgi:hypothetical protein